MSAEYAAGTAPFQDDVAYRSLVFDFLTSQAQMMLAWSERAESAITAMSRRTEQQRSADGVRRVAQVRATYPEPHSAFPVHRRTGWEAGRMEPVLRAVEVLVLGRADGARGQLLR